MDQAPADTDLRNIIDKLAQFVARNGPEFEQMTKNKQKDNPKFSFLFGGEYFNYYQYKVTTEQAILKQKGINPMQNADPRLNVSQQQQSSVGAVNNVGMHQNNGLNSVQANMGPAGNPPNIHSSGPPPVHHTGPPNTGPGHMSGHIPVQQNSIGGRSTAWLQNELSNLQTQQSTLQDQVRQSEANLNAQHNALMQQQQGRVEDAVRLAQENCLQTSAQNTNTDLVTFDSVLQPIIDSCTKDSISAGKAWILQHSITLESNQVIAEHLLKRVIQETTFTHKLHIIYLVNDVLHHCARKKSLDLRKAMESVVVPMFCNASLVATEEQLTKLNKLLSLWESKSNYFEEGIIEKLKDPSGSWTDYQTSIMHQHSSAITPITATTKQTFDNYQAQHQAFVSHAMRQIQNIEQQKNAIDRQLKAPPATPMPNQANVPPPHAVPPMSGPPMTGPPMTGPPPPLSGPPPISGPPPTHSVPPPHAGPPPPHSGPPPHSNHPHDGPPREAGMPPFGGPPPHDGPPFVGRPPPPHDDRSPYDERPPPYGGRPHDDDRPPYGGRPQDDDRPPYGGRPHDDDRPPYGGRPHDDDRPPYGGRPLDDEMPPYGGRPLDDDRPPYGGRSHDDDRPPYGGRPHDEDRPPYGVRPHDDGPPFGGRPRDDGPPYGGRPRDEGPPYGGRPHDEGPPYGGRPHDEGPPYGGRPHDEGPPYGGRPHDEGPPYGGRPLDDGPPYGGRPHDDGPPYGGRQHDDGPYGGRPGRDDGPPYGSRPHDDGPPYGGRPHDEGPPYGGRPGRDDGPPYGGRPHDEGPPYGGRPGRDDGPPYGGHHYDDGPYGGPPRDGPYGGGMHPDYPPHRGPPLSGSPHGPPFGPPHGPPHVGPHGPHPRDLPGMGPPHVGPPHGGMPPLGGPPHGGMPPHHHGGPPPHDLNFSQPPPNWNHPPGPAVPPSGPPPNMPPVLQVDLSKPPPGFLGPPPGPQPLMSQEIIIQPEDLLPSMPYFELPAGLMVPLIKLEDFSYKALDADHIRLPPPAPPSDRLITAVDAFYAPPNHDSPRDSDGWEKLGLYEYYRAKNAAKKRKEDDIKAGVRPKSRSPSPIVRPRSKSPSPPKKRYRSKSKSKSRSRSPRDRGRSRSRSPAPATPNHNSRRSNRNSHSSSRRRRRNSSKMNDSQTPDRRVDRSERSPTPPSFLGSTYGKTQDSSIDESNKGHQLLRKMGWGGAGLGANEQGIEAPISGGEIRDRVDQYKGVGINLNDPYENFRKSKGQAFITRMKARAEERAEERSDRTE